MNYQRIQDLAERLIRENGRDLNFYKLSRDSADPSKPWKGPAGGAQEIEKVNTPGAFVIGNTSIPTESRGLAFDWIDSDLLRITRHVCIVSARDNPVMEDYKVMHDPADDTRWNILWGQCLKPGPVRLLYVFGMKE
jgi:hypothetical protein